MVPVTVAEVVQKASCLNYFIEGYSSTILYGLKAGANGERYKIQSQRPQIIQVPITFLKSRGHIHSKSQTAARP